MLLGLPQPTSNPRYPELWAVNEIYIASKSWKPLTGYLNHPHNGRAAIIFCIWRTARPVIKAQGVAKIACGLNIAFGLQIFPHHPAVFQGNKEEHGLVHIQGFRATTESTALQNEGQWLCLDLASSYMGGGNSIISSVSQLKQWNGPLFFDR